jgi:hypothetical protein
VNARVVSYPAATLHQEITTHAKWKKKAKEKNNHPSMCFLESG